MEVVSGNGQTGAAGKALANPLVVLVKNTAGRPIAGRVVTFVATAGGGSLVAGSTSTNADGIAQDRWTLGPSATDSQVVEVRAENTTGDPRVYARFTAVAAADVPARLSVARGNAQPGLLGAPLPDTMTVILADRHGNGVPGMPVTWRVLAGGGAVSADSVTTDSIGRASARWTLGMRLDTLHWLQASSPGIPPITMFAEPALPSNATIVKVAGDAQTDSIGRTLANPLVAEVRIPDGRRAVGAPVTWQVRKGTGFVVPVSDLTDTAGRVAAVWTLGQDGRIDEPGQQVEASLPGGGRALFDATALVPRGAIALVAGDGQLGWTGFGLDSLLRVRIYDHLGAPVYAREVELLALYGGGYPTAHSTIANSAGEVEFAWTLGPVLGTQTLDASFVWFGDTIHLAAPAMATARRVVRWAQAQGLADWSDPMAWQSGAPPAADEIAWFTIGGDYTATVTGAHTAARVLFELQWGTHQLRLTTGGSLTTQRLKINTVDVEVVGGVLESEEVFGDGDIHLWHGTMRARKLDARFRFRGGGEKRIAADTIIMVSADWDNAYGTLFVEGGPRIAIGNVTTLRWTDDTALASVRIASADGLTANIEKDGVWEWNLETGGDPPPPLILNRINLTWANPAVALVGATSGTGVVHDLVLLEGDATFTVDGPIPPSGGWEFQVNPVVGVGLRAVYAEQ